MENLNENSFGVQRDSSTVSIWQKGVTYLQDFGNFNEGDIFDNLIVGGGITGITTALLLQEAGQKCILAEAHTLGYGTTGGTTSHINTFLDVSYNQLEENFGVDGSKLAADACKEAILSIKSLVDKYAIDCSFEYHNGYLFAESPQEEEELQKILEASARADVNVNYTNLIPLPLEFRRALSFTGQASFHPLKYIYALAKAFVDQGGVILEKAAITGVQNTGDFHVATSGALSINPLRIVYATHIPPGINLLHFRCAPYRSYALAARLNDGNYPDGLAYDMKDPYHYFRTQELDGKKFLIIGGNDHKTGHDSPDEAFASLENYLKTHYDVASINFRWSAQYYISPDGLPYIGKLPGFDKDVYTATGFGGNGITLGSISAQILKDLILGKENKYAELFSPSRIKPVAGFAEFVKENLDVAYHFINDRLSIKDISSLNDISPDTGAVIDFHNHKLAIYKDIAGEIHALSPVCPHAKCIVCWNNAEKSWDCPCHGSRFDIDGQVLTGPAEKALRKVQIGESRSVTGD